MKESVLIIDYKVGNHLSVANALKRLGYSFRISNKKEDIKEANALILPGVGAFGEAMKNLQALDIIDDLSKEVLDQKKPILGICLGMQLLAENSEEKGFHEGLGWIEGEIKKIQPSSSFKVPNVGWNSLDILKTEPLFTRADNNSHYYFDHSYGFVCQDIYISAKISHNQKFAAAVQKENIFGVQFHPEKSQNCGLKLIRSFFNYLENLNNKNN